jgi:hypothetical protein
VEIGNPLMYKAILFATDGDWVTDYRGCETIFEVEQHLANQGSKWYFYPLEFVIVDKKYTDMNQRIVSAPDYPIEFKFLEGKTIKTVQEYIREHGAEICGYL